jgi:uncharacterized protein YdeI (YjbR/CyaY-like superfamily)
MEPRFFATPQELRAWLEAHHGTESELVVGLWKKASGRGGITWEQLVDEVLCFGWIDGVGGRIDEDARKIRITPRKKGSTWSNRNVARVEALRAEGRMTEAGEQAFAARREDRSGTYSFERTEEARLTPEQEAVFRADEGAWAWFQAQPPGYRRTALHLVVSAKREETRERRLRQLIACSAAGERIPQLRR